MTKIANAKGEARKGPGVVGMLAAIPFEPLRVGGILTLVTAILAVQAVEADLLPYAPEEAALGGPADPVIARVGEDPIRVSDLRAQAGADGATEPAALVRQGYLDDAAQQLALAQAAERDGLGEALEVRAALALARRRVLSEAYLDLAVSRAVTDASIRAAYAEEVEAARAHDRVSARHILTLTEAAADEAKRRLGRGEGFARLARQLSQDEATKETGGSFGMIHPDTLPEGLAEVVDTVPLGTVAGPVRTEAGWHLIRVDARRRLAVPPFEAREAKIEEALRAQAMRDAAQRARAVAAFEAVDLESAENGRTAAGGDAEAEDDTGAGSGVPEAAPSLRAAQQP